MSLEKLIHFRMRLYKFEYYVSRAVEHGSEESSGLGELFSKQVDHISDKHLQFFAKWYSLLSEEEQCCRMRDGPPFWLSTAEQRYNKIL